MLRVTNDGQFARDGAAFAAWAAPTLNMVLRASGRAAAEKLADALSEALEEAGWSVAVGKRGLYVATRRAEEFAERVVNRFAVWYNGEGRSRWKRNRPSSTTPTCCEVRVMAKVLSSRVQAWIKANEGKHPCHCGCGQPITVLPHHRSQGLPMYISGHNNVTVPLADKLLARVNKDAPGGCWIWTGPTCRRGYGAISSRCRLYQTHRVSYELAFGPIPDGKWVLHRCDTPACVNPDHLFLGDSQANVADMIAKGRQAKGTGNGQSKLTEDTAAAILKEAGYYGRGGPTQRELGEKYGVTSSVVGSLLRGETWKHVPRPHGVRPRRKSPRASRRETTQEKAK
jgi:hypothetical protein